jgi:hypothetical protein
VRAKAVGRAAEQERGGGFLERSLDRIIIGANKGYPVIR